MSRRPPRSTRTDTLFPYTTLFRSVGSTLRSNYYAPAYRPAWDSRWGVPRAGRNLTYVRHYNDPLLVNARNGKVVRVYRNHFPVAPSGSDEKEGQDGRPSGTFLMGAQSPQTWSARIPRPEKRRVGEECGRTCRTR